MSKHMDKMYGNHFIQHSVINGIRYNLVKNNDNVFIGHFDILDSGEIANLYVADGFRKKGYGTQLLSLAIRKQYFNAKTPFLYCFENNTIARNLYERNAFNLVKSDKKGLIKYSM